MAFIMKELLDTIPQTGRTEWIGIRPAKKAELVSVDNVTIDVAHGLDGDHYSKLNGKRLVTLIQAEHLTAVAAILNKKEIKPEEVRRNIVVSGINLLSLHKKQFAIGDEVILECTGYCHPCTRMETNLGPGGYNAMRGHGGLTAKVVKGGRISLNDEVRLVKSKHSAEQV